VWLGGWRGGNFVGKDALGSVEAGYLLLLELLHEYVV
jgi:hypothetical protein